MSKILDLQVEIEKIKFYEEKFQQNIQKYCQPSRWYSQGYWLRKYLGIPNFIQELPVMDHGVPLTDQMPPFYSEAPEPILISREGRKKALEKLGKKSYVTASVLPYCRKISKINKSKNAKGTIIFPSHSTHCVDVVLDWNTYAKQLLKLPQYLHPITVCVYWKDLLSDEYKAFLEQGMPVVTAGHIIDPDFALNFYKILSQSTYTSSNMIGSYTFYSIEMGIPFFLYGLEPQFNNWSNDPNDPPGLYSIKEHYNSKFSEFKEILEKENLFLFHENDSIVIREEAYELCLEKLGYNDEINKNELRRVIYEYWWNIKRQDLSEKWVVKMSIDMYYLFRGKLAKFKAKLLKKLFKIN